MAFFDWWAYLGTFVQSFYSWTTYNAGQFNSNIGWRQAQQYQKKNYSIAWITVARDDIRDMMSISVNRINNYMIVATLILSVAAGAIVSIGMDDRVPDHVVFSIYISIGSSVTFLMLSILFGVKGQNTAFTRTMKLLTYQMRPEPTAEYSHNYMKQSQWLERGGLAKMFRFPGIYPEYDIEKAAAKANENMQPPPSPVGAKGAKGSTGSVGSSAGVPIPVEVSLEDATPIETLELRSQQTTYLAKFADYMQFWLPYDVFAKYTMGIGVIALGQGSAYFALAQLITQGRFLIGVPMVCLSATFLITVVTVIQQNYRSDKWHMRFLAIVAACAGNVFATISAINRHYYLIDAICIPLSYLSHAIFYYVAPQVAQKGWNSEDSMNGFGSLSPQEEQEEQQRVRESLDGGPDGPTRGSDYIATEDQWEDGAEEELIDPRVEAENNMLENAVPMLRCLMLCDIWRWLLERWSRGESSSQGMSQAAASDGSYIEAVPTGNPDSLALPMLAREHLQKHLQNFDANMLEAGEAIAHLFASVTQPDVLWDYFLFRLGDSTVSEFRPKLPPHTAGFDPAELYPPKMKADPSLSDARSLPQLLLKAAAARESPATVES
mmetsp:Transcript_49774/g.116351  ORF Transcript_49774/g.116351 Transcript_49774/m.116351 type:complete len:607 (-) Transcript_49774:56-1876(-)